LLLLLLSLPPAEAPLLLPWVLLHQPQKHQLHVLLLLLLAGACLLLLLLTCHLLLLLLLLLLLHLASRCPQPHPAAQPQPVPASHG
jgi:hypothetical protein